MNSLITILLFFFSLSFSAKKKGNDGCSDPFIRRPKKAHGHIRLSKLRNIEALARSPEQSLDAPINNNKGKEGLPLIDTLDVRDPIIRQTYDIVEEEDFFEKFFSALENSIGYGKLSLKDIEVLKLVLLGKTPKEIGIETGVSRQAVEQRVQKIGERAIDILIQFGVVNEDSSQESVDKKAQHR